jgi:putative ABC transport system ATP-binding protein
MRPEPAPAAVCEGLVRIFWSPSGEVSALKGVDAVVPAGRLTAITGPSGSGKSSLLRILAAQEAEELLDRLGLADRAEHRPGQLSGGEQQRLAFAQAMIGRPALVVADEPTSELDSATTAELLAAVRALTRTGTTVVLATHDLLAAGAADRVIHLRSGTVAHEEVDGRRLAVIDGDGRVQLPEEALARFADRRVLVELIPDGVVLREPR